MTQLLPYELSGNKVSDKLIVFMHGWPDRTAIWDHIIPSLESDYLVLSLSYPNYSPKMKLKWGLDFKELADSARRTIEQVNDTNRKILVVAHDWGAGYAYDLDLYHPNFVNEMITLDIGAYFNLLNPMIIFYQWVLIFAFFIGGPIGKYISKSVIVGMFKYNPKWINEVDGSWNYSYYYLWKAYILSKLKIKKNPRDDYRPSVPTVFVWGEDKPMQFFNDKWVNTLKDDPKNEIISFKAGKHWLQLDEPETIKQLILKKVQSL